MILVLETSTGHTVFRSGVHQGTRPTDAHRQGNPALDGPETVPGLYIHKSECNAQLMSGYRSIEPRFFIWKFDKIVRIL